MPYPPRCVIPQWPHHVVQRGSRKDPTFHEDRDYLVYMRTLQKASLKHEMKILAYVLMTNHMHIVAVPDAEDSISLSLHQAHTEYATYFNRKYGVSGHVWESRPRMFAMHASYMWNAIRYVERNPVRAHMVERAEDYVWSSAAAHCELRDDNMISMDFLPTGFIENWSEWLRVEQSAEELKRIRKFTNTGRVWAEPELLKQLESLTGRKLIPAKRGRPPKKPPDSSTTLF